MACWAHLLISVLTNQSDVCHFWDYSTQRLWLPSCLASLALSLAHLARHHLWANLSRSFHGRGASSQHPARNWDLCSKNHFHEPGSRSFSHLALGWLQPQLTLGTWETLSQGIQLSLTPDKTKIIMFVFEATKYWDYLLHSIRFVTHKVTNIISSSWKY